jgi:hypothetical protein
MENKNKLGLTEYITQDTRNIYKITQTRWHEHADRINDRMPKMVTARMEGTMRSGRPRRGRMDAFKEDLKIMGIRNWHTVVRGRKEWRRIVVGSQDPQ